MIDRITPRFAFGCNWARFTRIIDQQRIDVACESIRTLLGVDDLRGRTFLDVGSGSGLFSLAARRLGAASIHSFDYDAESVACTAELRDGESVPAGGAWAVEHGDILDPDYVAGLGQFDVVYCWGVAHHTGDMLQAIDHLSRLVNPGGRLVLALYNDQGRQSDVWRAVKRTYGRVPRLLRPTYVVLAASPLEARFFARLALSGRPGDYFRAWRRTGRRGMSHWYDLVDWIGGYPFEVASPGDVVAWLHERGFRLESLRTVAGSHACNQFVFERRLA